MTMYVWIWARSYENEKWSENNNETWTVVETEWNDYDMAMWICDVLKSMTLWNVGIDVEWNMKCWMKMKCMRIWMDLMWDNKE